MIKYNKQVIIALKKSEEEMYNLSHEIVGIEHFILATLSFKNNISALLNKYGITYKKYKSKLSANTKSINNKFIFYSFDLKKAIDLASDNATEFSSSEVLLEHIYLSILDENKSFGLSVLKNLNLDISLFYKDLIKTVKNQKNLFVYEIGTNLNDLAIANKLDKVIGRDKEINNIIEILARKNKNNPLLIGEAGVGKTALIEELSRMITKNKVPDFLKDKVIVSINIASVISGTKYRGEFEEKLTKILKECEEVDNIIIFIDEVHTIVGAGGAEGAIDASNILKPILARGNLKIIGATTINEYKKFISIDKALDRRFQKVYVHETSKEETYNILKKIRKDYEKFHNVKLDDNILKNIVYLSDKYIFDRKQPDKSIDILDEVCASTNIYNYNLNLNEKKKELESLKREKEVFIKNENYLQAEKLKEKEQSILNSINLNKNLEKKVSIETLKKIIESKCNSKIYDLNNNDDIYKYIEINLHKQIIGQNSAIKKIINILKISNNKNEKSPTSLLIYGPTGVGKTGTIKELAKLNNCNLIKLDMSEYTSDISVNKIIGSPQGYVGYNDYNTALEEVKLKPNSFILLEEIDRAHPSVINLFLSILEDGTLKTSKNDIINFNNCTIFMTTNYFKTDFLGYTSDNNTHINDFFKEEFINRINYIIDFKSLTKSDIKKIILLNVEKIKSEYSKNINFSDKKINEIIKESSYKELGARNIKNIIKKHVEKSLISYTTL